MANLNKVILIGRLTRDPESRTFANGGKVTKIGFAVTNRKKNGQTGQWEDDPMFIDCEVFNRGETGTLATLVEERCRKGSQICIEGRLHLDSWDDKTTGQKRTKHKIVVESVQLLDPRTDGMSGGGGGGAMTGGGSSSYGGNRAPQAAPPAARSGSGFSNDGFDDGPGPSHDDGNEKDIPF
jgi:single-strand DNA-binding protein